MKKLTITVSGQVGTGKSSICRIIHDTLKKKGIDVSVKLEIEDFDTVTPELAKRCIKRLKNEKDFSVQIVEKQERREIIDNRLYKLKNE